MVVMKGTRQLRSFAVVQVQKESGCVTKFNESSRSKLVLKISLGSRLPYISQSIVIIPLEINASESK